MMRKWIFSIAIAAAFATTSSHQEICAGFLPVNSLRIPLGARLHAMSDEPSGLGLEEGQFNTVLDRVQLMFQDEFASRGGQLRIDRLWRDPNVNAMAFRAGLNQQVWGVAMYGGMARFPGMTEDAFAAVACHEIGHHLGGAPKLVNDWASVEGQSDYYAATKCLKRMFERDDNALILASRGAVDPLAIQECAQAHASRQDQDLCTRATDAALALSAVFKALEGFKGDYSLATPDPQRVAKTYSRHPRGQCRLDTFFQGALCRVSPWEPASNDDPATGYCTDPSSFSLGLRPSCWYAP